MSTTIIASITKSVSMQGATFSTVTEVVSGDNANIVESTYPSTSSSGTGGTPVEVSTTFEVADVQLLYMLADSAAVDVIFTGTGGTPTTIRCQPGVAKLYNVAGGDANPITTATGTITMTVTNNGTQGVTTDFHMRLITAS